ncbi:MAG: ketoacyl-synthetase C-terminal extension domain-containing protein [Rhodobacter sp.]|nr:ketoacyl-synthetase C-terminal extension domain-containing protein [Rhodobacter sp.]
MPNPRIDFDGGPFPIPTAATVWPNTKRPRRAAVNSLGLGGTNAFMILQEAPVRKAKPAVEPARQLLAPSARSPAALGELSGRWRTRLARTSGAETTALCSAALQHAAHHDYRRTCTGKDTQERIDAGPASLYGATPMTDAAPPSYPFARDRYWLELHSLGSVGDASLLGPPARMPVTSASGQPVTRRPSLDDGPPRLRRANPAGGCRSERSGQGRRGRVGQGRNDQQPACNGIRDRGLDHTCHRSARPRPSPSEAARSCGEPPLRPDGGHLGILSKAG